MRAHFHNFEVHLNFLVLDEQIVNRPPYMSVSEWLAFWKELEKKNQEALDDG